ncbi:hypothetical protein ACRS2D_00355, partial [Riemerella anatipestifer]
MTTENAKVKMNKGILEFCLLDLLSNKEMSVSDLMGVLPDGDFDVVEGTLYPLQILKIKVSLEFHNKTLVRNLWVGIQFSLRNLKSQGFYRRSLTSSNNFTVSAQFQSRNQKYQ